MEQIYLLLLLHVLFFIKKKNTSRKGNDEKLWIKYQVIGDNHVAVPTHFYKIIVVESKDSKLYLECYVLPNQVIPENIPLRDFQVNSVKLNIRYILIVHKVKILNFL